MKGIRIGIIGGTRGMGKWFARFFLRQGYTVAVCDETTGLTPTDLAGSCDVVIVSVPIGRTLEVIEAIGPRLSRKGLLMDLTSLKAFSVEAMLRYSTSEVIGCHPLFGPRVRSLSGRSMVLCPARTRRWLPWLRSVLRKAGVRIVEMTPEDHDRRMALIQGLNHLNSLVLGMAISGAGIDLSNHARLSTPVFDQKIKLMERVFCSNPRLYAEIIALNPDMERMLVFYEQALDALKSLIKRKDAEGLVALMALHASRLWPDP